MPKPKPANPAHTSQDSLGKRAREIVRSPRPAVTDAQTAIELVHGIDASIDPLPKAKTICDYLKEHHEPFSELPFTPVDSLILSALVYLNFDVYQHGDTTALEPVPLIDILRFGDYREMLSGGWMRQSEDLPEFLNALARNRRYADLAVSFFTNDTAEVIEKQFCACTFTVASASESPIAYIAYRGTDGTLAGWKEDFNLSYRSIIPSQQSAALYASGVLSALPKRYQVFIGGHSKGGNLAEFAALTIDETAYQRIERIFNHDGPSFLSSPAPRMESAHFKAKLDKTVPESSIFGMILEKRDGFRIVQSQATGFFQHVPFTWLVDGTDFATQETLNAGAAMFDETLDKWLRSCTPQQREVFIDTVFDLIMASDAKSWADFQNGLAGNLVAALRDGANLDDETKDIMVQTVKNLGNVTGDTLRGRIGDIALRMRNAVGIGPQTDQDNGSTAAN